VFSGRKRSGWYLKNVRHGKRIAKTEIASVDFKSARPHHAFQKKFKRFFNIRLGKRHRAGIYCLPVILVFSGEGCLGCTLSILTKMRGSLFYSKSGVSKSSGKKHFTGKIFPLDIPLSGKIYRL
jgi:hypothetical protein